MEGQIDSPQAPAPAPVSASTPPLQTTPAPAPVQEMESGGVFAKSGKMNMKDIVISALLVAVSVFGIIYYRKRLKEMEENKNNTQIDDLVSDVDEIKMNVKKMMGNAYKAV